jgi:hypothetical protein
MHNSLRCRTYSKLFSARFQSGLPLRSVRPLDPLVDVLPPGPGSLDFSPACFGTFHTDLMPACVYSDVLSLFYLNSCLCFAASCPVERPCRFLLTHHGFRASLGLL